MSAASATGVVERLTRQLISPAGSICRCSPGPAALLPFALVQGVHEMSCRRTGGRWRRCEGSDRQTKPIASEMPGRWRSDVRPASSARLRGSSDMAGMLPVSTSSNGRRDRGPHAEPLLGAPGLVSLYLGEAQLRGEAHRAGVGGLGKEHHRPSATPMNAVVPISTATNTAGKPVNVGTDVGPGTLAITPNGATVYALDLPSARPRHRPVRLPGAPRPRPPRLPRSSPAPRPPRALDSVAPATNTTPAARGVFAGCQSLAPAPYGDP